MITLDTLTGYLTQYGWQFDRADDTTLGTGFRGEDGEFRVFISLAEAWVLLAIVPFVPPPSPVARLRFARLAMRLSYEMSLAKLALDPEGDVALLVELPAADLTYDQFSLGLDTLTFWANKYYRQLLNLARDPQASLDDITDTWGNTSYEQQPGPGPR